jgi:hypothetical protein
MKVITKNDTRTFTDGHGDSLMLLVAVRHRDALKRDEIEAQAALRQMKEAGITMSDAMKMRREASKEDIEEARAEQAKKDELEPETRRFMLEAVAVRLTIDGADIGGDAILEAYDNMTEPDARWVDARVDEVWAGATASEEERAKPDASAGTA